MPEYVFNGGDARDYFPAHIGRVEPGEKRTLDEAPDANWSLVTPAPSPVAKTPVTPPASPPTD
jgi:hypothetical protein